MIKLVNSISNRMSLRNPQRISLEILADILDTVPLGKGENPEKALEIIKQTYPSVTNFERDFPSVCFSLATGVGKTRLMGAFITYLFLINKSRHFFVLAPNLTIYNKLISDFSPNSAKYVFKGISEFATNRPILITGETYEDGQGVRLEHTVEKQRGPLRQYDTGETVFLQQRLFQSEETVFINIFNVSKIDSKARKGATPKIKTPRETIGESYFDYLSGLPDLVMLMDEAHRYRAAAGQKAINELKPILGLELTATPKAAGSNAQEFKNVIYSYPLSAALTDGYVKEPAVATRTDFRPEEHTPENLESIKLEDGAKHHEHVKVELEVYSKQTGKHLVHPFMLVVAQDITHASNLRAYLESNEFREGRYKGKVIEVHSNQTGLESDEATERLLKVEHDSNTEIVIHVNKLKEGWDVNNLYTIVPLRAFVADILTEQTIGRGLRLPYGERTGVEAIDRLTIIAHDKFQAVVDEANKPDSIIRKTITIGKDGDIPDEKSKAVTVPSLLDSLVSGGNELSETSFSNQASAVLDTPEKRQIASVVLKVVKQFESLDSSERLQDPEVRREIEERVKEAIAPAQLQIAGIAQSPDIAPIVDAMTKTYIELTIDIPKITQVVVNQVNYGFNDFDLKHLSSISYEPVTQDILIQELRTNERSFLISHDLVVREERLEDYIVKALIDQPEINYDKHADLLYKLAGQVVSRLKAYLPSDDDVTNVLLYYQKALTKFIFLQMLEHCWEVEPEFEVKISGGFMSLKPANYNISAEGARNFREPVSDKNAIKRMVFAGFKRCCYAIQKFDSDSERRFSVILENDESVIKWMKPGAGQLQIEWRSGFQYQPDFVVETDTEKFLCEPKAANEIESEEVQLKARAAMNWCENATKHASKFGGKPWSYLLIPHTEIQDNRTLKGLKASFLARC